MSKTCLGVVTLSAALTSIGLTTTPGRAFGPIEYEPEPLYSGFPGGDDDFGYSLAIEWPYLAVGALMDDIDGEDSGAVYVYNLVSRNFLYAPFASDVGPGDRLGYSVAIDNGLLYATSRRDEVGGVETAGSVYLFDLGLNGRFIRRITAEVPTTIGSYGDNVSVSDGLLLVGAPLALVDGTQAGAVYAYETQFYNQILILTPTDGTPLGRYGTSTAINSDFVVVGSSRNDIGVGIGESGSVYVYDFVSGNQLHKLTPNDPQTGSQFGTTVAIQGDLIAVGAPLTDDRGLSSGSVYLFDAVSGNQIDKIIADDTDGADWFGRSIAMSDDVLVIGAPFKEEPGNLIGAVYLYDINTHKFIDKILSPAGGLESRFGFVVASDDDEIMTSNYNQFENGLDTGVAYFIDAICPADINDDGVLDFFDISDLLNDRPDYNGDGVFNFFDVSAFLNDYNMGCP
ncbi:MAG: hypothetical protein ACF8MF_09740 [Phycisphaerales bacterium JB052]